MSLKKLRRIFHATRLTQNVSVPPEVLGDALDEVMKLERRERLMEEARKKHGEAVARRNAANCSWQDYINQQDKEKDR